MEQDNKKTVKKYKTKVSACKSVHSCLPREQSRERERDSKIEKEHTHKKELNNILITERMTFADEAECVVCAFIPSNNIALGKRDPHGLHLLVSGINEK